MAEKFEKKKGTVWWVFWLLDKAHTNVAVWHVRQVNEEC